MRVVFFVMQYTSHMTGIISLAADSAALGDYANALLLMGYIACFVLGAICTTMLTLWAKCYHLHSQYALPLIVEAIMLIGFALGWQNLEGQDGVLPLFIAVICFVMGLQNALITKVSSAIIRTTHITGMTTDLGIEIGRLLVAKRGCSDRISSIKNAQHHGVIIVTFLVGGVVGAMGVNIIGVMTFVIIASFLLIIAWGQVRRDYTLFVKIKIRNKRSNGHG